jgi:hypothetical protein
VDAGSAISGPACGREIRRIQNRRPGDQENSKQEVRRSGESHFEKKKKIS